MRPNFIGQGHNVILTLIEASSQAALSHDFCPKFYPVIDLEHYVIFKRTYPYGEADFKLYAQTLFLLFAQKLLKHRRSSGPQLTRMFRAHFGGKFRKVIPSPHAL